MAGRLNRKVAIVTGAGSGIGRAAATLFAAEGAKVMCADLNESGVSETVSRIGASAIAARVDVTVPAEVERMVASTVKAFGKLDVMYANAGIGEAGNAIDLTFEQWNRMIAINLTSVWLSSKYALPEMLKAGGGSIINQSSLAGLVGIGGIAHYSAAKAGVIGLTRQVAVEYGPKKVRCNAICPGTIFTPLVETVWSKGGGVAGGGADMEETKKRSALRYPMGRLGELADCANLALFLASDESSWITGYAVPLDGGMSAA
ncbi:MAG: SDR family oxidoreductase [Betaproteobacteria bacterium]|nr:SDR family oxidoreductase [Betaproteobacteria bacterium]